MLELRRYKESAPLSLAYLYSSRRQTGLTTIYKERVRLYRRIPIPRGRSVHLVGDYLSTNLFRIFDTILLTRENLATQPLLPLELSLNHDASAKVRNKLEIKKEKGEKFCFTPENR